MIGNLLFALLMVGFVLLIRGVYILTAIRLGLQEMMIETEKNIKKNKKLQNYTIEMIFITFLIVVILLAVSLFAHEGVM